MEVESNAPIAAAQITLDCREAQFHGTKSIATFKTLTQADGTFTFTAKQLSGCDFMYVHVVKTGFQEVLSPMNLTPDGSMDFSTVQKLVLMAAIP